MFGHWGFIACGSTGNWNSPEGTKVPERPPDVSRSRWPSCHFAMTWWRGVEEAQRVRKMSAIRTHKMVSAMECSYVGCFDWQKFASTALALSAVFKNVSSVSLGQDSFLDGTWACFVSVVGPGIDYRCFKLIHCRSTGQWRPAGDVSSCPVILYYIVGRTTKEGQN